MVKLFWDTNEQRGQGQAEFKPEDYRTVLERISTVGGIALAFQPEEGLRRSERPYVPVRIGNNRTGWGVTAAEMSDRAARTAEAAAEVISRVFTAEQDISSLAMEVADRYEELNFLYEMSARVGALLDEDEICDFVVKEAAWLMSCERASIMVADQQTGGMKIRASVGLPDNIPDGVTVRPGEGISGKVFESGHSIIVNEGDPMPADSLRVRELKEANCFLSVPLKISLQKHGQEQVLGVFNLTRKRQSSMFTASDLKLVSAVAATAATQIHNCRLINAERQRRELEHELELAAKIQLSLLPKEPLRTGALEVGGHCWLARHVGGDLFDYWLVDDHVCLVIADVSGHDMGAALMAAAFRSVVRSESGHRRSVPGLMAQVNHALFEDLVRSELFISAFYAELELATGEVTFCRAGHPKPLLVQLGEKGWLDTEGLLLGLQEDGQFEERTARLSRGDTIVLYTDGLLDAQGADRRAFGTDGLRNAALDSLTAPPEQMALKILEAARAHCGGAPLLDDMTAVVVRFGELQEK
jgi:sigma-B regulation protein RsbU (phosphoserine phosphatase)